MEWPVAHGRLSMLRAPAFLVDTHGNAILHSAVGSLLSFALFVRGALPRLHALQHRFADQHLGYARVPTADLNASVFILHPGQPPVRRLGHPKRLVARGQRRRARHGLLVGHTTPKLTESATRPTMKT